MIKRVYSQPTTKALVVRFAGVFLASKPGTGGGTIEDTADIDDSHTGDDDWGW